MSQRTQSGQRVRLHRVGRSCARSTTRKGVSLLDLTISVMIVAVITGIAVPRFSSVTQAYSADAAAQRMVSDLERARRRARTTGTSETIAFDVDGDRYTFSSVASLESSGVPYTVELGQSPYSADLVKVAFDSETSLTFNGFGVPASSGAMVIAVGRERREVTVDASSGLITVN